MHVENVQGRQCHIIFSEKTKLWDAPQPRQGLVINPKPSNYIKLHPYIWGEGGIIEYWGGGVIYPGGYSFSAIPMHGPRTMPQPPSPPTKAWGPPSSWAGPGLPTPDGHVGPALNPAVRLCTYVRL